MLIRIITWIFVIGIIYRFVSRYVLPVFRITSRVRQMQDQMGNNQPVNNAPRGKGKKEGDYIDYEEVK